MWLGYICTGVCNIIAQMGYIDNKGIKHASMLKLGKHFLCTGEFSVCNKVKIHVEKNHTDVTLL